MVRTIHGKKVNSICHNVLAHPEFSNLSIACCSYQVMLSEPPDDVVHTKTVSNSSNSKADIVKDFIRGEELATEISPKCGSCKCGKCPVVGHTYSFREEQELNMIRENLKYNPEKECWSTSYPWVMDPSHLPNNYYSALATLKSTEQTLLKDKTWAKLYSEQIMDMLHRQVAQKLTPEEVSSWHGPCFYISHLAVHNPQSKSLRGGCSTLISPDLLQEAENQVVKDVQRDISDEASRKNGKYSNLQPELSPDGFWIIGGRLKRSNPMTIDDEPQKLLPYHHPVTHLIMVSAHEESGHRSRDATLAKFRQKFWVPHGSKLAASVKHECQLCKLREPTLLDQRMGLLPEDRLKPGPAFSKVMVDLFGPYKVRGEVQKRISGKAYGIIFTDLVMRAVHIEASFGYDTDSFLLALCRFTSIRGWPDTLYSDCGSQLVGAERELKNVWQNLDRTALVRKGTQNGMSWKFGAPDSPWHQGAVESLVKQAKRSIHFAIHNQRMSPVEFLSVCAEVSNLLNERPIGAMPASDSEVNVLTPNNLLLGRASGKNPGSGAFGSTDLSVQYHFVQAVVDSFWKRWVELCAPALVLHKKWHTSCRNLQPGDVVIVSDTNSLRGEYRLGVVRDVFPGDDGRVRKVSLSYKNCGVSSGRHRGGDGFVTVIRSVQKLSLLVPADKQLWSFRCARKH